MQEVIRRRWNCVLTRHDIYRAAEGGEGGTPFKNLNQHRKETLKRTTTSSQEDKNHPIAPKPNVEQNLHEDEDDESSVTKNTQVSLSAGSNVIHCKVELNSTVAV